MNHSRTVSLGSSSCNAITVAGVVGDNPVDPDNVGAMAVPMLSCHPPQPQLIPTKFSTLVQGTFCY